MFRVSLHLATRVHRMCVQRASAVDAERANVRDSEYPRRLSSLLSTWRTTAVTAVILHSPEFQISVEISLARERRVITRPRKSARQLSTSPREISRKVDERFRKVEQRTHVRLGLFVPHSFLPLSAFSPAVKFHENAHFLLARGAALRAVNTVRPPNSQTDANSLQRARINARVSSRAFHVGSHRETSQNTGISAVTIAKTFTGRASRAAVSPTAARAVFVRITRDWFAARRLIKG